MHLNHYPENATITEPQIHTHDRAVQFDAAQAVKELLDLCHSHNVLVSTGGFIEQLLTQGPEAVARYIDECKRLGFDIVEISTGG